MQPQLCVGAPLTASVLPGRLAATSPRPRDLWRLLQLRSRVYKHDAGAACRNVRLLESGLTQCRRFVSPDVRLCGSLLFNSAACCHGADNAFIISIEITRRRKVFCLAPSQIRGNGRFLSSQHSGRGVDPLFAVWRAVIIHNYMAWLGSGGGGGGGRWDREL